MAAVGGRRRSLWIEDAVADFLCAELGLFWALVL